MQTQTDNHFIELDTLALKELIKGGFAGSVQTEQLTVTYTDLKSNVAIPLHHPVEEAIDIILEGQLEMQIGDSTCILTTGMISTVPSNIPHSARALTDCKVVTIFYPRRKL